MQVPYLYNYIPFFPPSKISTTSLRVVGSPTFPGKITYGIFGNLLSFSVCQTGIPGHTCPNTFALLTCKAFVPTSLDVIPPLATTKAGVTFNFPTNDCGRIGVAAHATGIAKGAYEYALNYAKERVQFGKPIAKQQVIAFKLADMYAKIEAAEAVTLKAAWTKDQHEPFTVAAAVAKLTGTNTAMEVTTEAVQVLGGTGFTMDHPVERMMRDSKITQIYEGTNEIQKLVISGAILR